MGSDNDTKVMTSKREVIKVLINRQNDKWRLAQQINDPGFLKVELIIDEPLQKKIKIGLVEKTIIKMRNIIGQQQKIIRNDTFTEIKTALGNEISVLEDLSKLVKIQNIAKMIEKIDELDFRMGQTMARIKQL